MRPKQSFVVDDAEVDRMLEELRMPIKDMWRPLGPPSTGRRHPAAGIGHALVERGYHVFYARATDLVQRLQAARRDVALEVASRPAGHRLHGLASPCPSPRLDPFPLRHHRPCHDPGRLILIVAGVPEASGAGRRCV